MGAYEAHLILHKNYKPMGGNALKQLGIHTRRVEKPEFLKLCTELKNILLKENSPYKKVEVVESYKNKKDHGDIDLIALTSNDMKRGKDGKDWDIATKELLSTKHSIKNSNTLSVEFKGVQVDITVHTHNSLFLTNLSYCNYSPLGNIVGTMLKQVGVKWGIDGLSYPVRKEKNPSQILKTIPLSYNIDEILNFAGLDENMWKKGFNTQEEIFLFSTRCAFFNQDVFQEENLSGSNKRRSKKRKDYQAWVDFLKENHPPSLFPYPGKIGSSSWDNNRKSWIKTISDYFPNANLLEEEVLAKELEEENRRNHEKLSGKKIKQLTGLKEKELGTLIKSFKEETKKNYGSFEGWIKNVEEKEAELIFKEFFKKYKNTPNKNI